MNLKKKKEPSLGQIGAEKIAAVLGKGKNLLIFLVAVTVVYLVFKIYFDLLPIQFMSASFRVAIGFLLLLWSVPLFIRMKRRGKDEPKLKTPWYIPFYAFIVYFAVVVALEFFSSPLFMANDYRALIQVNDGARFEDSVENYTTMQIPVVDKALAEKLGDKKLGNDNYGSQYHVGEYVMINYSENLYWIAPIEFNGFFPWVNRKVSPGYVLVNANDASDVSIRFCELHYLDSAYLWRDLNRNDYLAYPARLREGNPHLELDEEGNPRFVETVYTNRFALVNGLDAIGVIVTDPVSGRAEYYDTADAPVWIDHIQSEDVVIDQLNYWGRYVNGFMNSVFAKKDVLEVSTGINYVYSNGQMYMQTGMTSAGSDESIVGVMMVDMRTKQARFSRVGGATEYAASQSAIGAEQDMRFSSSDPIMINVDGVPTYFMMLKDNEGLVKRYAYVNVEDYTVVKTAPTRTSALELYKNAVFGTQQDGEEFTVREIEKIGEYAYIRFEPKEGTDVGNHVFRVAIDVNFEIAFLSAGDKVKIRYTFENQHYIINSLIVTGEP
ncbi:MAG: hypothetical protein SOT34_07055 [Candidatus Borkfalkiaceae bacterium]|nr:hypothetical protein [Christensenellaceae bacterium]